MGSQLYDSETNELVWVNQNFPGPLKNDVLGHVLPTWSPLIGLDENGNGDKLKVSRELDIQNGVYGTDFDGDSAKAIMDNLNNSFSENYSIEFFAYDWRKDLKLVEQQLRDDIQKKGYKKVSFVCHSTGGLLAASYIAESIHKNEQNKIDKVVTLGSPLYGTFVSHQALELGENDMFAELGIPDIALPYIYDWAKKTIRNMPCSYQLLPSNEFLSKNKSYLYSYGSVRICPSIKTIDNIEMFYDVMDKSYTNNQTLNTKMIDGSEVSHKTYRDNYLYGMDIFSVFNKVDSLHIAGNNIKTQTGAIYEFSTDDNLWNSNSESIKTYLHEYVTEYNGDGTVPLDSAIMTHNDLFGVAEEIDNKIIYPDINHMQLIKEDKVFEDVAGFLRTGYIPQENNNSRYSLRTSSISDNRLAIYIDGKTDIYIYDSTGNKVSSIINGDSYSVFNFDLFTYTFINEEKGNLYIPSNGYKVGLKAREETEVSILIKIRSAESRTWSIKGKGFWK